MFPVAVFLAEYGWYFLFLCIGVYVVLQHLQKKRLSQNQRAAPEDSSGQLFFYALLFSSCLFLCRPFSGTLLWLTWPCCLNLFSRSCISGETTRGNGGCAEEDARGARCKSCRFPWKATWSEINSLHKYLLCEFMLAGLALKFFVLCVLKLEEEKRQQKIEKWESMKEGKSFKGNQRVTQASHVL